MKTRYYTINWLVLFALAVLALLLAAQSAAAATPPITVPFDHLTTGFELDGVHRDLPCEFCHLNAVFKGTPRDCGTCHITGSQYNATPKTATHIASTNNCAACHNTISFRPDVHFEHREALGACVTCHNGTIAQGKDPNPNVHPTTNNECAACHTVITWNPPKTVDHTQIPLAVAGFCIICHNGNPWSGKPANHIATTLECGDCHLTTTWTGATFDHTGITTGCFSCHNGTKAVGKQASHMPTTNLCENCHTTGIGTSTPSWVPSAFDHTQMTVQTCQTCHSGSVKISTGFVSGQPSNHVPVTNPQVNDCSLCHGNTPAAETWTVLAASIPILHTGLSTNNCLECHAGQTFAGVPAPYTPMTISGVSPTHSTPLAPPHIPILAGIDCSACHGPAYQAGGFGPATAMSVKTHTYVSTTCNTCHDTGKAFYVGSGTPLQLRPADHVSSNDPRMATGDCSLCHTTTDWTSNAMPSGHMPNPANLTCVQCHASAPSDYTPSTLAAVSALHSGITGNCGLCHGNNVAALTWFNNYTPKDAILTPAHIPYLAGTDCSSCHASNFVTGGFGPTNMSAAKHAFVPTSCDTCHEAGLSFYLGASTPALQGRPADHIASGGQQATGDCSGCHTTTDWTSNTFPPGHMPNPGNAACSVCHTAIGSTLASYATLASVAVLHTGITSNCGACHGSNVAALTWYNNYTPKDAILTPAHIPYLTGSDCSSCHASNFATGGFGPTNMSAAKHAFVPTSCDTCHEAGLSFYLGASTPALQGRPADHVANGGLQATGDCSGCHTTTDWTSNTLPPGHMPNPAAQACSVCHTAIGPTLASYATLASVAVLHTGITSNCGACHGSNVAALTWYNNYTPKDAILTPAHIPYLAGTDCSSCHASNFATGGFGPTNMSAAKHAFVPTSCDTCHEAGLSFYLGASTPPLQGRPADHVANGGQQATGDCSGCHTTTDWTANSFPAGHMPNPGNQACSVCHTAIGSTLASYATLASITVLHTGIASGCQACHGSPAAALTFYNNNDNPKAAAGLSPAHIPYSNGVDCVSCHTINFVTGGFSGTTMSAAKHSFVPTTCDTCHEAGLSFYPGTALNLQGRPATHVSAPNPPSQATGDCSLCHNTTTWTTPTTLPNGHMPIPGTQTCSVCHTGTLTANPTSYAQLASIPILHTGIATGCAQCHGGATALTFYNNNDNPLSAATLSPAHIPAFTGEDCSACHTPNYATGGFGPMNMTQATHAGVGSTCNNCHEAGLNFYMGAANPKLQGRPADHTGNMAAPADCNGCHTTANWNTNTLPAGHMPNPGNQACNTCHTAAPTNYATMASVAVLHTGIAGGCAQCHGVTQLTFYNNNDNPKAAVLSPAHIPINSGADCGACHAANYVVGGFGPMNMTQATHAQVSATCTTCHEAGLSFYMGTANPGLQGRPADHTQGQMVAPNDCSLCHTTANWNSNTLPAGHMPNPGNQACAVCHTAAPTNYATMASISALHTGITNACATCHGMTQLTFYNNNDNPKAAVLSPAHIPINSGTDCGSCHASNFVAGGFGPMNMSQATHAFVSTTCDTCHGTATVSFYMGSASPTLQLRPADHTSGTMLTGDCSGCHTTANWNSNALPAGHMPNPGNQACSVCHTAAPTNYATMASISVLHTGITNGCATCHGMTQLTFYNNNDNPKAAVLSPAHIPINSGTDCGSCHASNFVAGGFGPMNMSQATHAFVSTTCNTCHGTATVSFYMGAASPTLQLRPADHTTGTMLTGDCSGCHTTANWNSTALPAGHMPNPGNQACNTCHTAAPSNYATLAANAVLHTGISSGCIACHGAPNATAPVFYLNFTPKASSGLSPVHIPTSTTACESCHSNTTFTSFSGTTMSSAKHTAMFAVIGKTCDGCHDASTLKFYGVTNLTTRPNGHHVGQDCSGCHNTNNWNGGAAVKKQTTASATTARSTVAAVVAAPTTAATTNTSANATNSTKNAMVTTDAPRPVHGDRGDRGIRLASPAFSATERSASMTHVGVTANCSSCHNGTLATGKGPTHVPSNNMCQNCHTTMAWLPARFDHQGIAASCVTCHNGALAPGKPTRHIQATQDCGACHNTLNWQTVAFSHVGVNGTCVSCHNGISATGKQPQHAATIQDCGSCHNTLSWTVTAAPNTLRPLLRGGSRGNRTNGPTQ